MPQSFIDLSKMKSADQNEAIAKWMGWKRGKVTVIGSWIRPDGHRDELPNFTNDLNTIFSAINQAFPNQVPMGYYHPQWGTFEDNLKLAIGCSPDHWNDRDYQMATAAHRAEALLRTLKLWQE